MVVVSSLMYVLSDSEIMDDLRSIYKGKSNMLTKSHIQSSKCAGCLSVAVVSIILFY